jgi:hypothetical protein
LDELRTQAGAGGDRATRDREIAYFAFNFASDMAGHGIPGLKPLEAVLLMAINQANIAPLTRDPAARSRYGALENAAPDEERRPVSVRAVAASMQLPYETARRNIRRLEAHGACVTSEAGVVAPTAFMSSPAYAEAARIGHERLHALYRMLSARGLLEPLPAANYQEREPPIRGVARLMADYLLRSAEAVGARSGDLITTLVLLPLLAAAAATESGPPVATSAGALARRTRLPAETVRRHVLALVEAGTCVSGPGGVALAAGTLEAPSWRGLLRENAIAVQRLFAGLAERGVVDVWEQLAAQATPAQRSSSSSG